MGSQEEIQIRRFVCCQLRDSPDLSTLTLGILRRRYLAFVDHESLSPEAKKVMKRVVEEELTKMQDSGKDGSEPETPPAMPRQKKRKREKENEELINRGEDEDESKAKKFRHQSSSAEVEEKEDCKTGSEESEEEQQTNKTGDEEQKVRNKEEQEEQENKDGISEEERNSKDEESEEEKTESEKPKQRKIFSESDSDDEDQKQTIKKTEKDEKNGVKKTKNTREGKKTSSQQDGDDGINSEGSSSESSEEAGEKEALMEKKNDEVVEDSDSSSLPSLEDEKDNVTEKTEKTEVVKKKKNIKKEKNSPKGKKDENKAVVRLKRYISLCSGRRNFNKLLSGCHSVRAKVAALKKELEDLGVEGQPSVVKCKQVRLNREEAQELADLDVSNIITTQGRPKRRAAAGWQGQHGSPSSPYQRKLNSSSDSDADGHPGRVSKRVKDWGNLQGIISDNGDSD